jgi:hypothetical protein
MTHHLSHFFGGGCGEHLLASSLPLVGACLALGRIYLAALRGRLFGPGDDEA